MGGGRGLEGRRSQLAAAAHAARSSQQCRHRVSAARRICTSRVTFRSLECCPAVSSVTSMFARREQGSESNDEGEQRVNAVPNILHSGYPGDVSRNHLEASHFQHFSFRDRLRTDYRTRSCTRRSRLCRSRVTIAGILDEAAGLPGGQARGWLADTAVGSSANAARVLSPQRA
jgi:hypothetical protein